MNRTSVIDVIKVLHFVKINEKWICFEFTGAFNNVLRLNIKINHIEKPIRNVL